MDLKEQIASLNDAFVYRSDTRFGTWRVLDLSDGGHVYGDCDDYGLTVAYFVAGNSLWRLFKMVASGKIELWHCHVGKAGHFVVKYDGQYIDNIHKKWVKSLSYQMEHRYGVVKLAFKIALGKLLGK